MLVSEIATQVQNSIGDRGGILARDDLIISWVNEAILDIFRKTSLGRTNPEQISQSTAEWTPANEILRVHFIYAEYGELQEMSYDELINLYGPTYLTTAGAPKFFYRGFTSGQNTIRFLPVPDQAYTLTLSVTYVPTRVTLVSDNTETIIPISYDYDIVEFCKMRALELQRDFQAAETARGHYERSRAERIDESRNIDDGYHTITPDEYDYL